MTSAVDETRLVDELRLLEAEAVHIIREVVAELERPTPPGCPRQSSS
jgi:sulfate adenylyltransferase subunit 2